MYKLRDYQEEALADTIDFIENSKSNSGVCVIPCGGGKCYGRGYEVLMADDSYKKIEEIRTGDVVQGIKEPQRVVETHTGADQMYLIQPKDCKEFLVNSKHILVLQENILGSVNQVEMSMEEYDSLSQEEKEKLFLYKKSLEQIEFIAKKDKIERYYGFTLEKDPLFIGQDDIVQHNSLQIAKTVEYLMSKDDCIVIVQPNKEILEQNFEKYSSYGGVATVCSASMSEKIISQVTFGTIGTLKKFIKEIEFTAKGRDVYIIIDEIHTGFSPEEGSECQKFIRELKPKKIIGFTATPIRLYTCGSKENHWSELKILTRTLPKICDEIFHVTQINHLVKNNYWAPLEYYQVAYDTSKLKFNTTYSEYTDKSIQQANKEQGVLDKAISLGKKAVASMKGTIIFTDTIENAEMIASKIPHSSVIHSQMSLKERAKIIEDFKTGKLKLLSNVGVVSIGFDYPCLDCVIIARPTASLARFYQYAGRCVRPCEGKDRALLIDLCGNIKRFGKLENLLFEDFGLYVGWQMLSNDKVLSGVPINSDINITRQNLLEQQKAKMEQKQKRQQMQKLVKENSKKPYEEMIFYFGKYSGQRVIDIVNSNRGYIEWFLENVEPRDEQMEKLREACYHLLKEKQMDSVGQDFVINKW